MSARWTPEQFDAHQRRHGFTGLIAPASALPGHPAAVRCDQKAERIIHSAIMAELSRREIPYVRARMDKKSSLPEGWPDFSIYPPGGLTLFVEVKTETGKLSLEQERCHQRLIGLGYAVIVVRSVAFFIDVLNAHLRRHEKVTRLP